MTKQEKIDLEYKNIGAEYLHPRPDTGYSVINDYSYARSKFNKDLVEISSEICTDVYLNDSTRAILIPKALVGIRDNNGWIKLEGIANEIKCEGGIWTTSEGGHIVYYGGDDYLPIGYATHYQPALKPKPPIY